MVHDSWKVRCWSYFLLLSVNCVLGACWSSNEWSFRVNLDLWTVYVGMFAAIAMIKVREYRLTDHPRWHSVDITSIGIISAVIILRYFAYFELYQESKYTYNAWHPYICLPMDPILAFTILRILKSHFEICDLASFIGKYSLETFLFNPIFGLLSTLKEPCLSFLVELDASRWRPINFILITVMFIYLSDRVAHAMMQQHRSRITFVETVTRISSHLWWAQRRQSSIDAQSQRWSRKSIARAWDTSIIETQTVKPPKAMPSLTVWVSIQYDRDGGWTVCIWQMRRYLEKDGRRD